MTPLSEKLEKAITQAEAHRHNPERFASVKDYVSDLRERGILQPKTYDIPLIDTIGRASYKSKR